MLTTPQQIKREELKSITDKILQEDRVVLTALSIVATHVLEKGHTSTNFSFEFRNPKKSVVTLKAQQGLGFIDSLFVGLHAKFAPKYSSLQNIQLCDFKVNPTILSSMNRIGTDAQASVSLSVRVKNHDVAEFYHRSRSIMRSSFIAVLDAFEFYINCEKCFVKLQDFIQEAKSRNRGDVVNSYIYDLCKLTEVNTYSEKEEKGN